MIQSFLERDADLTQRLRVAEKPGLLRSLAILCAHSGDSWFWLIGLGLLYLLGNDYWKSRAIFLAVGILVTAGVVFAIKFLVRRERPKGEWGEIYRKTDPHSFPSGHSTRAALLATLALAIGPAWFGWLLLIWAPMVILSRVAMGVHYLSDVLAGALLGVILALVILLISPQFGFLF
jgi:membrane-associated phospholipid phosphatase